MATVSGSRTSSTVSSSTTHYTGPQIRDTTKDPKAQQSTRPQKTEKPMAQAAHAQERTPSSAPSRLAAQDGNQTNSSPAGLNPLELVEITSNPLIEGILGPNKDGRVRNPVPSKLKGKTDHKQGNFGVMHMGMSPGKKDAIHGRDAAAERDAAARKTSEATASRAKAAQSDKYVPPTRRIMEAALNDSAATRASPFATSREQRTRPLAPDETKFEQARLLTLLRSINPITVVDQICKAVAYFGGIPGAPPPEDGIFPESANTRETGSLFIGWLAEIFPDLSARSPETSKESHTGKKKAGRPVQGTRISSDGDSITGELPNSRNGYGYGPAVSAPTWGLPPSLGAVHDTAPAVPTSVPEARKPEEEKIKQSESQRPSTPNKTQAEDSNTVSTSKKRRGRPKGSRNKKGDGQKSSENDVVNTTPAEVQDHGKAAPHSSETSSTATKVITTPQDPSTASSFVPISSHSSAAAKSNQAHTQAQTQAHQFGEQPWSNNQPQAPNQTGPNSSLPTGDELSPEERAVLEAFRNHGPEAMNVAPSPVVSANSAPEGGQKRKRGAPKVKMNSAPTSTYSVEPQSAPAASAALPVDDDASVGIAKDALQWAAGDAPTTTGPPPKRPRQRKVKVSISSVPPSRNQTASVVSSATPPHAAPSTIADTQATSSQQSISVTRAPVEGLEAHYERFNSLQQQQQNGRSHTPTMIQPHVRAQSKPSSAPSVPPPPSVPQTQPQQQQHQQQQPPPQQPPQPTPQSQQPPQPPQSQQQTTPQMQQQQIPQQIPQQKSMLNAMQNALQNTQPSTQRDDLKMAQATSARPLSASYYNQRSQASTANTYNQQYPANQSSRIFSGHQPSPQMGNGAYRPSSTHSMTQPSPHTMTQPSPQFSHAETSYRTSSPHAATISQPSPSFSQNDANFRASSAHNLAQPSPSFSQADNTYRTPSAHTQSTSYSTARALSHAHSAHQNHFGNFPDSSYIDLPTLDSLGHSSSTGNPTVSPSTAGYGQGLNVGLGNPRTSATNNSSYGSTSILGNAYDASSNDLLRGISRTATHTNSAYSSSSSTLGNAYDSTTEQDIHERMLRGVGPQR